MIASGASRSNGAFFSRHLMRADHNERVAVVEMKGFAYAEDVPSAFREMKQRADGTACKNYFYHANLNPRADEHLTPEQWDTAIGILERHLGLEGQQRLVIEHDKEGRTHRHVIWSRVDADTMTTIHDGHNYRRHEDAAREIEEAFQLRPVERCLTRDKEATPRPERCPADWETFRAQESKIDPKAMKAELTELWQHSDSGPAFAAALEERGYILARGDRRDFCVIDAAGDEHSLGRRISGVKAAEIRSRMADIDPLTLPSVEEGRALARARQDEQPQEGGAASPQVEEKPSGATAPVEAMPPAQVQPEALAAPEPQRDHAATAVVVAAGAVLAFEAIRARRVQEAEAAPLMPEEQADPPAERFERFRAWCAGVREYVQEFGQQVQDYWRGWFGQREEEPAPEQAAPQGTPQSIVTAPSLETPPTHKPQQGMEPSL